MQFAAGQDRINAIHQYQRKKHMPLNSYGVLKGRPIARKLGAGASPHYQVHIVDDHFDYRIAVNVKSKLNPSELEYLVVEDFAHPVLEQLPGLELGFTETERAPGSLSLDYIRANLFNRDRMKPLPHNVPGPDNDLNEKIDAVMQRAISDEHALVYAFGERWGPERDRKDKHFGFLPGNGIHDIHMNQGNSQNFRAQDGVWQDGGLLIHFPAAGGAPESWTAVFLKFQSQAWHTDDVNGHALAGPPPIEPPIDPPPPDPPTDPPPIDPPPDPPPPDPPSTDPPATEPQGNIRIVAALVNPIGPGPEAETVTILNRTAEEISLDLWSLADRNKRKQVLGGSIAAGAAQVIALSADVQLSNKGGIITLLNAQGLKVDGVSYTKTQAGREGWTVVF